MVRRDLTSETAEDKSNIEAEARARGIDPYKVRASKAVGDRLVANLVSDFRRPISQSTSMIPPRSAEPPSPKGSGWIDSAPVKPPSGVDYVDRLCEAQSRADRAAAVRQKIEIEWIEAHFRRDPYRAATEYSPFDKKRLGHDDEE